MSVGSSVLLVVVASAMGWSVLVSAAVGLGCALALRAGGDPDPGGDCGVSIAIIS